jgi:glycosyltransferase involved in cell wall biosynthesis
MNIVIATYGDLHSNSALHVHNIANRLQLAGHRCIVAVPGDTATESNIGAALFQPISMKRWDARAVDRCMDGSVDLVVAWTPREVVRRFVEPVCRQTKAPYVVHLEDNEDAIVAAHWGVPLDQVLECSRRFWDKKKRLAFSHPYRMRDFLSKAAGVTVLGDALLQFVPRGVRSHVFWPGWNEESFSEHPSHDGPTREKLGLSQDACVIVYQGNSHPANAADMRSLYAAIAVANRAGTPARLIRIGCDHVDFLGDLASIVSPYVTNIGYLPDHRMIAPYLALADVCVQPGKANAFNECRFPSKIPEFLIAGKPLVMAKTNIGKVLRHQTDAWIMEHGDSIEIAKGICELHSDPALRKRLGENASAWARSRLSWSIAIEGLEPFYEACSRRSAAGSKGFEQAAPHDESEDHP